MSTKSYCWSILFLNVISLKFKSLQIFKPMASSYGFPLGFSSGFPLLFLWFSSASLWLSYGLLTTFPHFREVFLWFPMAFGWNSYGGYSYGTPMVFLCLFTMDCLWLSYGFPLVFLRVSTVLGLKTKKCCNTLSRLWWWWKRYFYFGRLLENLFAWYNFYLSRWTWNLRD
mgnify:CR=1 FL=1